MRQFRKTSSLLMVTTVLSSGGFTNLAMAQNWSGFYAGIIGGGGQLEAQLEADALAAGAPTTSYNTDTYTLVFQPPEGVSCSLVSDTTSTTFICTTAFVGDGPPVWDDQDFTLADENWFVGLQAGGDIQHGQFVFGLVGDVGVCSWFRTPEGEFDFTDVEGADPNAFASILAGLDGFATARARAGVAIDGLLLYGTAGAAAGAAYTEFKSNYFGPVDTYRDDWLALGWVAGVGFAIQLAPNVVVDVSALHLDFGEHESTFGDGEVDVGHANTALSANVVRVGLAIKTP